MMFFIVVVIIDTETLIPTGKSNKDYDHTEQHHQSSSHEYDPRRSEDPQNKRTLPSKTKMGKSKSQSSQLRGISDDDIGIM